MASKPGPSTNLSTVGPGIAMAAASASAPSTPGTSSTGAASGTTTQEFTVRIPRDRKKKLSMMKFATGLGLDFAKMTNTPVKLERENNLKEYKTANDLDMMPKTGAGSEFGRDQKEEARRRKYGIILKKYNPDEQPWQLKIGSGKQTKKYRGVREGTISENTSYYIFTQCADGAFEAYPVDEWYNFSPVIRYKYLDAEEAEEEFSRRDKILNFFMMKKHVNNKVDSADMDDEENTSRGKGAKSKKKKNDFQLTDMDDWADLSDEDNDDDDEDNEDEGKPKAKKSKAVGKGKKKVKNAKQNANDEAIEESDEGDYDDRELDYMSDTSSSGLSEPEEKDKKYEEKGVAEEDGLRNILNSDDEDEEAEEDENKEEDEAEEEEKKEEEKPGRERRSSSSSSGSDSDIERNEKIASAFLMQKPAMARKQMGDKGDNKAGTDGSSADSKSLKRKAEGDSPPAKKSKKEHSTSFGSSSRDGITEDTIRRYLQRKPMTTKDLLQKFRSKKLNMTNEQMSTTIAQILKRINPERSTINKKLYLSLRKPE